jgi:chemotaxis protein MotB
MRRRGKKEEEHENTERWLISYADFITLLFTFFAALYALSSMDKAKADKFTGSLRQAFKVIEQPIPIYEEKTASLIEDIKQNIKDAAGMSAKADMRGVVVTFSDSSLFASGSADIKSDTVETLAKLADTLKNSSGRIIIEGHTDNIPLSGGRYSSNWDLSTARAASVLNFFIAKGVDPNRFSIAGYAEYKPVADNATEEGRAKNRRVEMVISK